MAIDANAITIDEYAMQSNDPLIKKISYSILETGSALRDIPIATKKTLRKRGMRWIDNLPGVNHTPLNSPPVVTKGKPTPWAEQVYIVANQFQIDEFYMDEDNAIENPLDSQVKAWMEHAFKFDFNNAFINNAHDGVTGHDPNNIVGIKARLDNPSQFGVNSEMKIDANVNISPADIATNAESFIEVMEQGLDYVGAPNGDDCTLYCNDLFKRRFNRAVRSLGAGAGFEMTKDAFGRNIETFRGMRIQDLGRQAPTVGGAQTGRIISLTENTDGTDTGSGTATSAYIVRYGDDYFSGWQMRPLKPKNLGLDPTNGAVYNVVIRWAFGLWQEHTRSICRLFNFVTS